MKTKKQIIALALMSIASLTMADSKSNLYNTQNLRQFEYNRGLKVGLEQGYKKGYRDAIQFAKRQIRLYGDTIKAYEAGKYLKEYDHKISDPAVYQINQGGNVRVIVRGCRIVKPLTPSEIIDLPQYPVDASGAAKFKYYNMDATSNSNPFSNGTFTNSSNVVARDGNGFYASRPLNPYSNNASYIFLKNTALTRQKLSLFNVNYTTDGNKIKVVFANQRDRAQFMQRMSR